MNYGRRISNGVMYVGVVFSVLLGGLFALALIFGEDSDWWMRIFFALLAIWAFVAGFVEGKSEEVPKNDGIFKATRQEKEDARKRLEERKQIERAYDAREYIILSALLLKFSKNGGVLRGLLPDKDADVLYDMAAQLELDFTAEEQLAMMAELIREKSAEVLRIGEDDAA
ncbi:hypothetical protein CPY53_04180 [Paenibacillus polymyxa]|uniref:hypothetical protein n=1 Tax=Paenibacillus polymyxa TaxID=1406 RepID=UPI001F5649B7|nr:hypothetical protein [Paenibacillus polymyxa]UNL92803.1 hypothetical protein CPY53_04180 [Paenibacillus polymyxa]